MNDNNREKLTFDDSNLLVQLVGPNSENLKIIEKELGIQVHIRGNELILAGDPKQVPIGKALLNQMYHMAQRGRFLDHADFVRAVRIFEANQQVELKEIFSDCVFASSNGVKILPKGVAQKQYIDAIRSNDIVFAIGPAGTGKTYLAMAMAMSALLNHEVKRVVLTRPAVEAGEKLGFLPGDLVEKVNPYLRPLYDALDDMMEFDRTQQLLTQGKIEVAPLAFMRGRTLNGAFVILDEAQNTTSEQMLMFLTRLGFDSRAVVTGDITQVDLPNGTTSGLVEARELLKEINGIKICEFCEKDVVRHPLVQKIIRAYDKRPQNQVHRR